MEAWRHTGEGLHRSAARSEGKQEHKQQTISQGEHEVPCEDPLTSVKTLSFGSYLVPTSCLEPSLNCESPGQLGQQGFKLLKLPSARRPQLSARRPQLGARLHNFFQRRLMEQAVDSWEQAVDSAEQAVDHSDSWREALDPPGVCILEALPCSSTSLPPLFHCSSTTLPSLFDHSLQHALLSFRALSLRGGVEEQ